jgi:hypothetical protein
MSLLDYTARPADVTGASTYRVSSAYGEPLYGFARFAASVQQATINVPGELINAVNLTPYSLDPTAGEAGDNMTYRPSNSDEADEARFGRMNRLRQCWAPIGTRPDVAAQLIRESICTVRSHQRMTLASIR